MNKHWRLFEEKNGDLYTLFHGVDGSRLVPEGEWLLADVKPVRDGSGGTEYMSGFHVFADESALDYLNRFKKARKLVAVQVLTQGTIPKPTNPRILLATRMMVPKGAERRVLTPAP